MRRSCLCTVVGNLLVSLALMLSLCVGVLTASAEYPERAITMVVPYPRGV